MTFDQITKKADETFGSDVFGSSLGARVSHVIDSARINADDTIYTDKAAAEHEWDKIAVSSLELNLGASRDADVLAWFRNIGLAW